MSSKIFGIRSPYLISTEAMVRAQVRMVNFRAVYEARVRTGACLSPSEGGTWRGPSKHRFEPRPPTAAVCTSDEGVAAVAVHGHQRQGVGGGAAVSAQPEDARARGAAGASGRPVLLDQRRRRVEPAPRNRRRERVTARRRQARLHAPARRGGTRGAVPNLGFVSHRSGSVISAWAAEGDFDPGQLVSQSFELEWPPASGQQQQFPEVDRAAWFDFETARRKLTNAQHPLLNRLITALQSI